MKTAVNWRQRQNSLVTDPRFSLHSGNRKQTNKPNQNQTKPKQKCEETKYKVAETKKNNSACAITNFGSVSHYRL